MDKLVSEITNIFNGLQYQMESLLPDLELEINQIITQKNTDDQLQIMQRNLVMTEERLKAGKVTSLDFRTIQNQYLNIAFSKVSSIYNLIVLKTEIDYLVGTFED